MYDNSDKNCDIDKREMIKIERVSGKMVIKYRLSISNCFQEEQRLI